MYFLPQNSEELIRTELPPYEQPPSWIPPQHRRNNPYYDNDLIRYLPRGVNLLRIRNNDALGFNICGGKEHSCGIFISKVLPNTKAHSLGLQEGDQILSVNNTHLQDTDHSQAVRILKQSTDVHLIVQFFPYGYQKTFEKTRIIMSPHER